MSKGNKDAYIVKFVERNGQKTELALQAYKVKHVKFFLISII